MSQILAIQKLLPATRYLAAANALDTTTLGWYFNRLPGPYVARKDAQIFKQAGFGGQVKAKGKATGKAKGKAR